MADPIDRDALVMEVAEHWFTLGGDPIAAAEYLNGILEKLQHDLISNGMHQDAATAELKSFIRRTSDTAQGILRRRFGTLS